MAAETFLVTFHDGYWRVNFDRSVVRRLSKPYSRTARDGHHCQGRGLPADSRRRARYGRHRRGGVGT
jgi:hypothetical protein